MLLDAVIYICAALVLVGCICLGYLGVGGGFHNQRMLALTITYATLFFVLTGAFFYFYQKLRIDLQRTAQATVEKSRTEQPFQIIYKGQMGTDVHAVNTAAVWYLTYGKNPIICPIHRVLWFEITNQQTVRSQVQTYRVDVQRSDGKWVALIWMDSTGGDVYWFNYGNPAHASKFETQMLDRNLAGRSMTPNETVQGAAIFELPESIPLTRPIRFYIRDYGGAEMIETFDKQPEGFTQGDFMRVSGDFDLSRAPVRYCGQSNQQDER